MKLIRDPVMFIRNYFTLVECFVDFGGREGCGRTFLLYDLFKVIFIFEEINNVPIVNKFVQSLFLTHVTIPKYVRSTAKRSIRTKLQKNSYTNLFT